MCAAGAIQYLNRLQLSESVAEDYLANPNLFECINPVDLWPLIFKPKSTKCTFSQYLHHSIIMDLGIAIFPNVNTSYYLCLHWER